ncbi:MAG: hypothetical protein JSW55_14855 [Chloroflexota bacterium]|nr:MAG: hypothetical protein JSW55_14855 [Chloroflexota bacterium]
MAKRFSMGSEDERRRLFIQALQTETSDKACQKCLDQLDAYVAAQLTGEDYLALYPDVALHLDLCSECADAYARIYELELAEREGSLPRPEQIPAPDLSFLRTGMEAVEPDKGSQATGLTLWDRLKDALAPLDPANWGARPAWQPALALGVVLLIAGIIALLLEPGSTDRFEVAAETPAPEAETRAAVIADATDPSQLEQTPIEPDATAVAQVSPVETPTGDISFSADFPPPTPESTAVGTRDVDLESQVIGHSVLGAPMEAVRFGDGLKNVVFVGGLHAGSAPGTVTLAQQAIEYFTNNLELIPEAITLYIVPSASPDSQPNPGELTGRLNANGVDLNRNWDCNWVQDARIRGQTVPGSGGSRPFSEPETETLAQFIQGVKPDAVVFWQARSSDGSVSPGSCDRQSIDSSLLAATYGLAAGYAVADFEGAFDQRLTGAGTDWLDGQGIPAISVLLPDYEVVDWNSNLSGMLAVMNSFAE